MVEPARPEVRAVIRVVHNTESNQRRTRHQADKADHTEKKTRRREHQRRPTHSHQPESNNRLRVEPAAPGNAYPTVCEVLLDLTARIAEKGASVRERQLLLLHTKSRSRHALHRR